MMLRTLRPIVVFIALFFIFPDAFAQSQTAKDSAYVMTIFRRTNNSPDPVATLKSMDSIIAYSQKHNFPKGIAIAYWRTAVSYMRMSEPEKAVAYIDKNVAFCKKHKLDKYLAETLLFASAFYNQSADYIKAFAAASDGLEAANRLKDDVMIGRSYLQIGRCYALKSDYAKSTESFNKAIAIFRKIQDIPQLRDALSELAKTHVDREEYPKALQLFSEAEHIAPEVPIDVFRLPHLYGNIARCYDNMGNSQQAVVYYEKTLALTGKLGPGMMVTDLITKMLLGELYLKMGNLEKAEKYLNQALEVAKITNTLDDLRNIYQDFAELYKRKGEHKKAFESQALYITYSDSIMDQEKMKALEDLTVKYQTNEVTAQNKLLALQKAYAEQKASRQNLWLIGLSVVLLLLVLSLYFYYRNNKQKQAISKLEKDQIKQKLLITQMNPHFIFNSIENIQGLIYQDKDDAAVDYLNKFSALTRQILEHSNENYISLEEETAMIRNYLAIQQLLYDNKFDYTIDIADSIEQEAIFLPPMLTQPFIENAIKHGLGNKQDRGMIDIRFYLDGQKLLFEVLDNGKGFSSEKKTTQHKSLAMTITKERLIVYTKDKDFVVQTDNLTRDGEIVGAKVSFEIPYIYEN